MYGAGIYGKSGSGGIKQTFTATASQTEFTATSMTLNDNLRVFIDGVMQDFGWSRVGQVVTFTTGLYAGQIVTFVN